MTGQFFSPWKNRRAKEPDIWSELEEVRRTGYALDLSEGYAPGVWAVAMALDLDSRFCPAALWVAGFKACLNDKKLNKIINGLRQTVDAINAAARTRSEEAYQKNENQPLATCN